jgi:cation diffusion facilitator CzcD-associated flavoprotein CzcO
MVLRLHAGKPALDALIVGAGQSGLVTAFALMRERVRNILAIDRAPAGKEGPWVTFARMPTLRSPKDQTGPDLGIPSLTFQAWYEAQHGAAAFASLHLIPSVDWHEYLQWRFMANILNAREGFPADTYARVMAFPDAFTMHAERPWTDARPARRHGSPTFTSSASVRR